MSFIDYVKEKSLTYLFIGLAFSFATIIFLLDQSSTLTQSNAQYIFMAWFILFVLFVPIDFYIINNRKKKFQQYCYLHASNGDCDEFSYPLDQHYAKFVHNLVIDFEMFKSNIAAKSTEEQEFMTKWLHDVKVPISATRLILEKHQDHLSNHFYESIDKELLVIEQSIQKVFYELKSNSFFHDYKITPTNTKKIIGASLKGFSSFFSYKKLNISIQGEPCDVLTDEKWSGYILSEIFSNAVKYTPEQGTISISTSKTNEATTISITNTGNGILEKDIGQVFNKGFTSSNDRVGMKATGYGLYLAKKICDLLGHTLTVQSIPGTSCTFHLTFVENETIYNNVTKM